MGPNGTYPLPDAPTTPTSSAAPTPAPSHFSPYPSPSLAPSAPYAAPALCANSPASTTVADPALSAIPAAPVVRLRTWPAVLALYVLAPVVGEMLSGSTPPLLFFTPFGLIFECGLYGSGALLVREVARRRGLGWGAILLLGAAYGILEEGLVVTSWFNPYWPDLGRLAGYGRALDTSWVWALGLTMYHAVVSITIPIVLVEALFPSKAGIPWLGRRGVRGFAIWLGVVSAIGAFLFGFVAYWKQGYQHPPAAYLLAFALAAGLVWLALHLRPHAPAAASQRAAPTLWKMRRDGFLTTAAFFFLLWVAPGFEPSAAVTFLALAALGAFSAWRVSVVSSSAGWSSEHRLALASGVLFFFILLAPLLEVWVHTKPMAGMTLVALLWLGGLVWLARRTGRRTARWQIGRA